MEKKVKCTNCGEMSILIYSNWKKRNEKTNKLEIIIKKDESLCPKCFKERTGMRGVLA